MIFRDMKFKVMAAAAALTMGGSNLAYAQDVQDLGGLADKVSSSFGSLIRLGMSGAFLVGVFFAIMGIMRLKAAADSQGQQVKYSEGLWRLGVAAALCGIPAVITILGGTAGISAGGGEGLLGTLDGYRGTSN